jgi:hypothetical protein
MLIPVKYTVSLPLVVSRLPPVVDDPTRIVDTVAGAWVMVSADAELVCPPTVTRHFMSRPKALTVTHVITVWPVTTLHDDAVYTADPAPGAWYVAETFDSPTAPRLDPRIVTTTPPTVGMLPRLAPTPTDSESIVGTAYDELTLPVDTPLDSRATVTFQRYPKPTPTTLTHVIVVWSTVTTHDVAVNDRFVLPPLYTATTGATEPPTGPKFVPTNTTSLPPDVFIGGPLADDSVGDAYVSTGTDHDPF